MTNTPIALKAQRERRQAFVAAGLTIYGTPRKNYRWPELDGLPPVARMNERIRICTLRSRRAKKRGGVTWLDEAKCHYTPAEWRMQTLLFRAEIQRLANSIASVFHDLPMQTQARCLAMETLLSGILKKLP